MALQIEGKKCPICNSYLFPEDDVVFCPVCGAPHHRDCYKFAGHCGLEDKHGTDEQYDLQEQKNEQKADDETKKEESAASDICPNCQNKLTPDMLVFPYCGRPRNARVITFDALGGVDKNIELEEGVTAGEAAKLVQINTHRYIPKFLQLKSRKASWNWAAFLFPEGWFLSRKMYKFGYLFICVILAAQICLMPLNVILNSVEFTNYTEMFRYIAENFTSFGRLPTILAAIGSLLAVSVNIIAGMFGDKIYRHHVLSRVKDLKDDDDREQKTRKQGGISFIAFLIGILVTNYAPRIIFMFF